MEGKFKESIKEEINLNSPPPFLILLLITILIIYYKALMQSYNFSYIKNKTKPGMIAVTVILALKRLKKGYNF